MSNPKLTISLVTWNSKNDLPLCLASIQAQTFRAFEIVIVDNASQDGTLEHIQKAPHIRVIRNDRNTGYCKAHNQAINASITPYVLCLNPDVTLSPRFLEILISKIEGDTTLGSASGKLLRPNTSLKNGQYSVRIDVASLQIFRSRKVINRGEGEADKKQYDAEEFVFGFSGSAVLLRRAALEQIKFGQEYFDEDFFAYKEDVDLAWRLQLAGWKALYVPSAIAFHSRRIRSLQPRKDRKLINRLSYRNQLLMIAKNELPSNFLRDLPFIIWYELRKFLYVFLLEQTTFLGFLQFLFLLPKMMKKRAQIMKMRKTSEGDLRSFID